MPLRRSRKRKQEKITEQASAAAAQKQPRLTEITEPASAVAEKPKLTWTTEERAAAVKQIRQQSRDVLKLERLHKRLRLEKAFEWRRASLQSVLIKLAEGLCLKDTSEGGACSSCLDNFFKAWADADRHALHSTFVGNFKAVVHTLVQIASEDIHHSSVKDLNDSASKLAN